MDYLQYLKIVQQDNNLILVLNLIINGLPSICNKAKSKNYRVTVLNLIINGLPSI